MASQNLHRLRRDAPRLYVNVLHTSPSQYYVEHMKATSVPQKLSVVFDIRCRMSPASIRVHICVNVFIFLFFGTQNPKVIHKNIEELSSQNRVIVCGSETRIMLFRPRRENGNGHIIPYTISYTYIHVFTHTHSHSHWRNKKWYEYKFNIYPIYGRRRGYSGRKRTSTYTGSGIHLLFVYAYPYV